MTHSDEVAELRKLLAAYSGGDIVGFRTRFRTFDDQDQTLVNASGEELATTYSEDTARFIAASVNYTRAALSAPPSHELLREALSALEPFRMEAYSWDAKKYTAPANTTELLWVDGFSPVLTGAECCDKCGYANQDSELATFTMGDLRRARATAEKLRAELEVG